jgi:hypothetical protein
MKSLENHIQLHSELCFGDHTSVEVSIKDLSELLFCTDRNSKLIIKKIVGLGWANWYHWHKHGFLANQLVDLKYKAEKELHPFPTFNAPFLGIYKQFNCGARYVKLKDITFSKKN